MRNGAIYLEREDEIGTVEAGKRADLVFKDGVAYDSAELFESVAGWVGVR